MSDVTGVAGVAVGASGVAGDAADIGDGLVSAGGLALNGSLLKLNANGFLQGAQGAQFLRSHQRQRARLFQRGQSGQRDGHTLPACPALRN